VGRFAFFRALDKDWVRHPGRRADGSSARGRVNIGGDGGEKKFRRSTEHLATERRFLRSPLRWQPPHLDHVSSIRSAQQERRARGIGRCACTELTFNVVCGTGFMKK